MGVLQKLQEKLNILKKNREAVPEAELQTKYAAAYNALISEIKKLKLLWLKERLHGMQVHVSQREELSTELKQKLTEVEEILDQEYDTKKASDVLTEFLCYKFMENKIVLCFDFED